MKKPFEELKNSGQLPTPSGVGMKILMLTQDEDCSLDDIVQTLMADPALTGRIIKLATSVQIAGTRQIGTVREAAVRLGTQTVTNVALGFTLISGNRSGHCEKFDYKRYWSQSLASAVAAQEISRSLKIGVPAEAFTCALLSRVGSLALASVHLSRYGNVIAKCEADPTLVLEDIEREQFQINHREVAASMLEDWGLPAIFSEAVLYVGLELKDAPLETVQARDLLRVLNAATAVGTACVDEFERQPSHWGSLRQICTELKIKAVDFCRLFDRITPLWNDWGQLLQLPTQQVMPLAQIEKEATKEQSEARSPTAPRAPKTGLRILAVDDDPVSLRLLVRHLERAGHEVSTATNGRHALAVALESNPQIVVTDWMMPEMDGIQLCKTLRRFGTGRSLYILILTGQGEEDRVVEAFDAGVDDYIVKPFKPKLLLARIRGGQRVVRLQERVEEDKKTQREQVAKLAVLTRKLRAAALTDALTDLPNRRYAMKRMEMEWANSLRADSPFSLITLDIDHFKAVNDSFGHDVGDIVLQETAAAIKRGLRRGDTCARMGGEEFLVLCPNTDEQNAEMVAERIRKGVEDNVVETPGQTVNITVSLGVSTRTPEIPTIEVLMKIADEAVYDAKDTGRNRVSIGRPRPADDQQSA
jgi:two-component system, cell cycle response regulator